MGHSLSLDESGKINIGMSLLEKLALNKHIIWGESPSSQEKKHASSNSFVLSIMTIAWHEDGLGCIPTGKPERGSF